jgi:hypothetical protein
MLTFQPFFDTRLSDDDSNDDEECSGLPVQTVNDSTTKKRKPLNPSFALFLFSVGFHHVNCRPFCSANCGASQAFPAAGKKFGDSSESD